MNQTTTAVLTALVAVGIAAPAAAHHSYAAYDRCQTVTIEGRIESVTWTNPHTLLAIRSGTSSPYRIEWFPLQQLQRAGVSVGVLKVGDVIVVTGSRKRDSETNVLSLLTEIRRPQDGWEWSRTATGMPSPCTR
jgi:hypothetical protein